MGLNGVYHVHTAFIVLTFGSAATSMVCCSSFDRQPVQTETDRQYIVDFYTPKLYDAKACGRVAQWISASDFGSEGRGFDPHRVHFLLP